MDTSYVAVGTVMYMITGSLTCRPQKNPPERGAAAALGAVLLGPPSPIHAAQHERTGRARSSSKRGRLYRWSARARAASGTAILHGLARRTAPQA